MTPREMPDVHALDVVEQPGRCLLCGGTGRHGGYHCPDCFGSGVQQPRRVPIVRDAQPARVFGDEP